MEAKNDESLKYNMNQQLHVLISNQWYLKMV